MPVPVTVVATVAFLGIVAIGIILYSAAYHHSHETPYQSRASEPYSAPAMTVPRVSEPKRSRRRYVRVLIINTSWCNELGDLVGTGIDRRRLETVFSNLNESSHRDIEYDVRVEENLTGDAIVNSIKDTDPNDTCMFACFVLACGSVAGVTGVDGGRCSTWDITNQLRGTRWEAIPKIFCVQAWHDSRARTHRELVAMEELVKNTFLFVSTVPTSVGVATSSRFVENLCKVIRIRAPLGWTLPVMFTEAMGRFAESCTSAQAPYFITTLSREYIFPAGGTCTGQHHLDRYMIQNARTAVLILKVDSCHQSAQPPVVRGVIESDISLLKSWLGSRCRYKVQVRRTDESSALETLLWNMQSTDSPDALLCFVLWSCTQFYHGRPDWRAIQLKETMARFAARGALDRNAVRGMTGKPKVLAFQAYGLDFAGHDDTEGARPPRFRCPIGADTVLVTGSLEVSPRGGGGIVEHFVSTAEYSEDGLWMLRDLHELRRKVNNDTKSDAVFASTLTREMVLTG